MIRILLFYYVLILGLKNELKILLLILGFSLLIPILGLKLSLIPILGLKLPLLFGFLKLKSDWE